MGDPFGLKISKTAEPPYHAQVCVCVWVCEHALFQPINM